MNKYILTKINKKQLKNMFLLFVPVTPQILFKFDDNIPTVKVANEQSF